MANHQNGGHKGMNAGAGRQKHVTHLCGQGCVSAINNKRSLKHVWLWQIPNICVTGVWEKKRKKAEVKKKYGTWKKLKTSQIWQNT